MSFRPTNVILSDIKDHSAVNDDSCNLSPHLLTSETNGDSNVESCVQASSDCTPMAA